MRENLPDSETVNYFNIFYDFPKGVTIESSKRNRIEGAAFIFLGMCMPTFGNLINEKILWFFLPYFAILGMVKMAEYSKIHICRSDRVIDICRRSLFGVYEKRRIEFDQVYLTRLENPLDLPDNLRSTFNINPYRVNIYYESFHQIHELTLLQGGNLRQMERVAADLKLTFKKQGHALLTELGKKFHLRPLSALSKTS